MGANVVSNLHRKDFIERRPSVESVGGRVMVSF